MIAIARLDEEVHIVFEFYSLNQICPFILRAVLVMQA